MPPFGAATFTDPKTGAKITSSPASNFPFLNPKVVIGVKVDELGEVKIEEVSLNFAQQPKSASSAVEKKPVVETGSIGQSSLEIKIDDYKVNKRTEEMNSVNRKIKNFLSNKLKFISKEDIEKIFIYRTVIMEIGSTKTAFIIPIGVWESINYNLPEDSPYRYSSVGGHKDQYMLVEIDKDGKVEGIFILVEFGAMFNPRMKCFVELSDNLGETNEDKTKLKLLRDKIEELLRPLDLMTHKISEQFKWGELVPFGKRPGEIEREIENSVLLKWLLSLPEAEDATVSSKVKILVPGGVGVGGTYADNYGLISGAPTSFVHEFAHHIFRNLRPEIKTAWIDFLKENDPEFIDNIINFSHKDRPGYDRDKMTPRQLEELCANEYFAFIIDGLDKADDEKSIAVEQFVELGILPEWMRPSALGFKENRLNEYYYLSLSKHLAKHNYVVESLGISERVVSRRLIMDPQTKLKTREIISGFREFYGNDKTDRLVNKLDKFMGSSPLNAHSKDSVLGGIDFRSLPIVTQAMTNLSANIGNSSINRLSEVNLDEEWQEIERMSSSGITPSAERIKEYIQASCFKRNVAQDIDKVVLCISDILRLEEERCDHTNPTLRDILVVLESMRNAQELRQVFLGKSI